MSSPAPAPAYSNFRSVRSGQDATPSKDGLSQAARIEATLQETCEATIALLERAFEIRASWALVYDSTTDHLVTGAVRGSGADYFEGFREPAGRGIVGLAFTQCHMVFVPNVQDDARWIHPARMYISGLRSVVVVPMQFRGTTVGVLGAAIPRFTEGAAPTPADIAQLEAIATCGAMGITNALRLAAVEDEFSRFRRVAEDRVELRRASPAARGVSEGSFAPEVVGTSEAIRAVLDEVALVAPTDCSVVILGETGTGKELIARVIHAHSRRASDALVALNCAALPESLVESELFGYEKGAFTGATSRKAGNFELAHRGTLLLDEIGDLPLQAQVKLLRAIQEREVMRLGGIRPVPVNVRLIAATNQNLESEVQDGRFRPDLFYRLSVFTLVIPPLRARRDDIPLLADYYIQRFARRLRKHVSDLSQEAIDRLVAYDWPGNVRELQNVIERAVILARHPVIDAELVTVPHVASGVPAATPRAETITIRPPREIPASQGDRVVPFSDAERRAILHALDSTAWRISGACGAAELLRLKPTTLHAKMKKLGIRRPAAQAGPVGTCPESSTSTSRH